ncbi:MAG: DNA topoisomerase VI subunit B [Methanomicrobiales archaeon]|nr:DNA topoisomerase VI subunit B [Methanomicrobiales archaeon]
MEIAEELARKQRSISVAEFFEKNKHLLGFDSPTRGIITTVKEAVDNALDACEEAGVLPDIFVQVRKISDDVFRIGVEDNGPGIVPEQIPPVFGKLLYGSRFHQIKQSRGQQGIGISAAILYAQLTTGMPAVIISRTDARKKAHRFELMIKTEANEPDVRSRQQVDWDRPHGTRVEIEFKSTLAAKKRLLEYLRYTSVVNPHARITADIDGEISTFERVSAEAIPCPKAIQPHPHGIELGTLKRMLSAQESMTLEVFLVENFSRVGKQVAREICEKARLSGEQKISMLQPADQKRLLSAMQSVQIPAPPASVCLSPIGEDLIRRSMDKEFSLDFVAARTRPSSVYSGHPFVVEAAIGYGGKLNADDKALILRFANRVPLLYQPGACAITNTIAGVNWKLYNISQQTLPAGPIIILVHVASTNVPFTSESKDAIASIPEIEREIGLGLKDLGRELKLFLSRRDKKRVADDRARAICAVIPEIAIKVGEIVEKPAPDTQAIEGKIMRKVIAKRRTVNGTVQIEVNNYTSQPLSLKIYDFSPDAATDALPKPAFSEKSGDEYTRVWNCELAAGGTWTARYGGRGPGHLDLQGIEEKQKVVMDLDV